MLLKLLIGMLASVTYVTMVSRQTKHRQKRFAEGSREITLMLSAASIAALDARKQEDGMSRVKVIEEWLLSDREISR